VRFAPAFLVLILPPLVAQEGPTTASSSDNDSFWTRFWISAQANLIRQQHSSFAALYSGPNSFLPEKDHATSRVETLYTGFQITNRLEILADVESAGGAGLSSALGIAGFTNVDVVRNPTLGEAPYFSRVMLHYTIPLSAETPKRRVIPWHSRQQCQCGAWSFALER
jgi:high affinity Mn2+ porin